MHIPQRVSFLTTIIAFNDLILLGLVLKINNHLGVIPTTSGELEVIFNNLRQFLLDYLLAGSFSVAGITFLS